MKPSFLFVVTTLNMGGAEKVTVNVINNLESRGYTVSIFLLKHEGELVNSISKNIKIYYGCEGNLKFNSLTIIKKLIKIAKEHNVIIGALELLPSYVAKICAVSTGRKFVAWVHTDLSLYIKEQSWLSRWVAKLFYSATSNIIFVSKGARESLKNICYRKQHKNWVVIPNLIDDVFFNNTIKREYVGRKYKLIWYGRFEHVKRVELLLRITKKLVDIDPRYELNIIGYGRNESEIINYIRFLGLQNNVKMYTKQRNIVPYLDCADIFVLTSEYEGFGNVIVESMARGLPIVSSNCPHGPREILSDGKYGVLIKSDKVDDYVYEIIRILSDKHCYNDYSAKSFKRSLSYNPIEIISRWESYLSEIEI